MDINKGETYDIITTNALTSKLDADGYSVRETRTERVTVRQVRRYKTGRVAVQVAFESHWATYSLQGATVVNGSIRVSDRITFVRVN